MEEFLSALKDATWYLIAFFLWLFFVFLTCRMATSAYFMSKQQYVDRLNKTAQPWRT